MKHISTYQIHDTFIITGRGIVLTGRILDGSIFSTNDILEFEFKGQILKRKISWIDNGMRVENGKPNIGIMIETENEDEISELRNWSPKLTIGKIYSNG
ncbi:hypothetical protein JBL43_18695 [Aureibaculum sp. A20]|uniref:Uncharacterized protein n=1 Tax=Aureibaculum flavum TaxID=2795986 RepID=A0ABS0WWF4_9FLAO|nr:hypothetical protein [Aureibaculum flavum]MBJ2176287.1 hypothetical protein [Aureibaculum flavum]